MDSHCEVNERWLEPLIDKIQKNESNVLIPIVDLIDPITFNYSEAMIAKGTFDWDMVNNKYII